MWIVPTDANREKVDSFLAAMCVSSKRSQVITSEEKAIIKKVKDLLEKTESAEGRDAKAYFCGKVFREMIREHTIISGGDRWEKLVDQIKIKTLEMCSTEGMIDAYIAFSVYFPEMCTREIQPFLFFGGRTKKTSTGENSVYSHRRVCELLKDPVFGPHMEVMLTMTNLKWLSHASHEEFPQRTGEWKPHVVEDTWGVSPTSVFGKFTNALKTGLRGLGEVKVVVGSGFTNPQSKSAAKWSSSGFSEDLRLNGLPIQEQQVSLTELHSVLATKIKHPIVLSSMVWGLCGDEGRREIEYHFKHDE